MLIKLYYTSGDVGVFFLKISHLVQRVFEKHWECSEDSPDSLSPINTKLIEYPEINLKKILQLSPTYIRSDERMENNQQVIKEFHVYEVGKPWIKERSFKHPLQI